MAIVMTSAGIFRKYTPMPLMQPIAAPTTITTRKLKIRDSFPPIRRFGPIIAPTIISDPVERSSPLSPAVMTKVTPMATVARTLARSRIAPMLLTFMNPSISSVLITPSAIMAPAAGM